MVRKKKKSDRSWADKYNDPTRPGSLGGVERFAKANGLSVAKAEHILQSVLSHTLHKPRRRRFPTSPTLVFGPDEQWQMDLVDMQKLKRWNGGHKYLLTVIDVFSKRAWAEPLRSKSGPDMVRALDRLAQTLYPFQPLRVQTDEGKEFYNKWVQAWFKNKGWHHFSTAGDAKAAVVERWHRTLKERMYRYFTAHNTLKYVDVLKDLIDEYNRTPHRSLGMAPVEVTEQNAPALFERLYGKFLKRGKVRKILRVGDRVRLNKKHKAFGKGYLPGWTEEVFQVSSVDRHLRPITYKIQEWDNTPVKGTFYAQDLQKVNVSDDDLFRVEKILKRQKGRMLVRWKGWPAKYDSWIPTTTHKK